MVKKMVFFLGLVLLASVRLLAAQENTPLENRTYYLHLPANHEQGEKFPLVIGLHPAVSSGKAMAVLTGLDAAADEQGFIALYPNTGDLLSWNDGRQNAFARQAPFDDAGYLTALIDEMVANYNADPTQVYLVGWGSGGLMAFRLACDMPEKFAGIATVGVLMWKEHRQNCDSEPTAPVNLLILHGKDDWFYQSRTYDYTSQFRPNDSVTILGAQDTVTFWANRNGCTTTTPTTIFRECANGVQVAYAGLPGSSQNWHRIGDYELNQVGVDVTQSVLDFFMRPNEWTAPITDFDGLPRTYNLYVPTSYTPETPMPLVVVLHGRPDTGVGIATITDMNIVAEQEGFIAVYPHGINQEWNYVKDIPLFNDTGIDDFAFLRSLMADLSKDFAIDPTRRYVTGFSNGGFMVNRLACEMTDEFAAFASVGGAAFTGMENVCAPHISVNMLLMHGTDDISIPWGGLTDFTRGNQLYAAFPVENTFGFWAVHNGCSQTTDVEDLPVLGNSPNTNVKVVRVPDCESGKELILYAIIGGGHNWPGVPGRISEQIAGRVNMDIHASEVIWEFFSRHVREVEN